MAKWKVLASEHLAKVVLYDQMFQNQGEELSVVLNEDQLLMCSCINKRNETW